MVSSVHKLSILIPGPSIAINGALVEVRTCGGTRSIGISTVFE
jgi:hypothetical protein